MFIQFILVLLIIGLAVIIYLLLKRNTGQAGDKLAVMIDRLRDLADQNRELRSAMDNKLSEVHKTTQEHFGKTSLIIQGVSSQANKIIADISSQSQKAIAEVTERLTKLDETNKQVVGFTDQLRNLEKVLTNSKNRGSLGESSLELIISNILPPQSYKTQYRFKNGDIADAVIKIKDKLLPVDSKFSLENYRRIINENDQEKKKLLEKDFKNDLKKRIDETSKYIKPNESTLDFAFMFIPAEGIYYDLLINEVGAVKVDTGGLIDYAFREKKVIIVSPTTFAAYLQTVLQGLRALQIEESAKEIRKYVELLGRHLFSYDELMKKLGQSMSTSVNHYNNAYKEFGKIDKDVMKITEKEKTIEPLLIDKPSLE